MINFRQYPNITKVVIPSGIKLSKNSVAGAFSSLVYMKSCNFNHPNITNMYMTYRNCYNLTSPVCGDNVTDMSYAYSDCYNLTGNPVCGNKVKNISGVYSNCRNLTGSPVCGNNVTVMAYAYSNCRNLTGDNIRFYSKNITSIMACFEFKNNTRRFNIHVPSNSKTLNTCLINNTWSMVKANITWTNAGSYYYNATYNIYIYPDL